MPRESKAAKRARRLAAALAREEAAKRAAAQPGVQAEGVVRVERGVARRRLAAMVLPYLALLLGDGSSPR